MQTTVAHSDITALEKSPRELQVMKDAVEKEVEKLKGNVETFAMSEGFSLPSLFSEEVQHQISHFPSSFHIS